MYVSLNIRDILYLILDLSAAALSNVLRLIAMLLQ